MAHSDARGSQPGNVTPSDVLGFWFDGVGDTEESIAAAVKRWYSGGERFDAEITDRFPGLPAWLASDAAREWAAQGPRGRLAAVIVLDQFSRNMHRGTPQAFATDPLALELADEALKAGEDRTLAPLERMFLLMPFEHSERMEDQKTSVTEFGKLAAEAREPYAKSLAGALDYAKRHADVIARFGRFPHRNAILGRTSTPDETEYLKQPGAGF